MSAPAVGQLKILEAGKMNQLTNSLSNTNNCKCKHVDSLPININEIGSFRYRNTNECVSILNRPSITRRCVNGLNGWHICQQRYRLNERNQPEPCQADGQEYTNANGGGHHRMPMAGFLVGPPRTAFIVNGLAERNYYDKELEKSQHLLILEMPRRVANGEKSEDKKANGCGQGKKTDGCKKYPKGANSNSLALRCQRFYRA